MIFLADGTVSFWSKFDWHSPYTYLGVLGAIGAPSTIWKSISWIRRIWGTSFARIRYPAILKDFYYKKRDFGYRILEDGKTYLSVRREVVVSSIDGLGSTPFSYRWTGEGEVFERVEPNTLEIEDAEAVVGKASVRKRIRFQKPLGKREEVAYSVVLQCNADNKQPLKFLSTGSSRRVDCLILRVAFPISRRPEHVTYKLLDSDGRESGRVILECTDYLTGEFRKEIQYPKPFYEHRIEWE